jgi:hypothetical protein
MATHTSGSETEEFGVARCAASPASNSARLVQSPPLPLVFVCSGLTTWPGVRVRRCSSSAGVVGPRRCGGRICCGLCVDGPIAGETIVSGADAGAGAGDGMKSVLFGCGRGFRGAGQSAADRTGGGCTTGGCGSRSFDSLQEAFCISSLPDFLANFCLHVSRTRSRFALLASSTPWMRC